jgi:hypothetical protein
MHFLRGAEVACEREGWSAQRPLDRSRKGEREGEGSRGPTWCLATRQEEGGSDMDRWLRWESGADSDAGIEEVGTCQRCDRGGACVGKGVLLGWPTWSWLEMSSAPFILIQINSS